MILILSKSAYSKGILIILNTFAIKTKTAKNNKSTNFSDDNWKMSLLEFF